jgi:hypothetical protein
MGQMGVRIIRSQLPLARWRHWIAACRCSEQDLVSGMKKCRKIKEKVLPKVYKEDLSRYESSLDNMLKSIAVYYRKGVMGKDKYRLVYKDSS